VSRRLAFAWLDVFTDTPLEGNGLAVVQDADGLGDDQMLRFARETGLSETTFVQTATVPGADYRNRIFTVREEVPFAGHPSLGTAVAVARARGEREARYVQQTPVGLQPVDVRLNGDRAHASVLQEAAEFGAEVDPAWVLAAVGVDARDADPALGPQIASTGLGVLIAPVRERAVVAGARPDFDAIDALLGPHGVQNLYLCACDPGSGRVHARMFSRLVDRGEDAATGSAAGPMCAYLARHSSCRRVVITQGVEMRRPSRLLAEMEDDRVRVGGGVVHLVEGTVTLP
jgi:trans-2,3-dihydro-3-hydroxyanthranilate isomerase